MMKKVLILLLVAMATISNVYASDKSDAEIVIGMNVANYDISAASSRIGFHAGVRVNFGLPSVTNGLYGNGAALISLRGAKVGDYTFNPYYLDVPIHLGYRYHVTNDVALIGEFGPYFAVGLFGQTDGMDVFSDEFGLNRFDLGLGLRAGVEFNHKVSASLGYDFGLLEVAEDTHTQNRNFYISLGYKF